MNEMIDKSSTLELKQQQQKILEQSEQLMLSEIK